MRYYELIERELFDDKSLAALIWLINGGRELEFSFNGTPCFITRDSSPKYVSLWVDKKEQSYNSMEELLSNADINGVPFLTAWGDIQIEFLF